MAGEEPSGDENQDDKDDDGNKTDAAGEANRRNGSIGGKSKKALEGNHSDRNEPRYIQATTITTA